MAKDKRPSLDTVLLATRNQLLKYQDGKDTAVVRTIRIGDVLDDLPDGIQEKLLERGEARLAHSSVVQRKAQEQAQAAGRPSAEERYVELDDQTVGDLRDIAVALNVDGKISKMKKDDLVEAIMIAEGYSLEEPEEGEDE